MAVRDARLAAVGALAKRFFADDPNTCLQKLRQFWELLALTNLSALRIKLEPALPARAFRGEVVRQDPNCEPADVLLARLRSRLPDDASSTARLPEHTKLGKVLL